MSQNVAVLKKVQVAERQKQVAELFLKNVKVTRISEMLGVDRKTIQRDLQQVKFVFRRSMPNEVSYNLAKLVLWDHAELSQQTKDLLVQAKTQEDAQGCLKILKKLWDSKTDFFVKIGVFEGIPEMLGTEQNLFRDTADFVTQLAKDSKKMHAKRKRAELRKEIERHLLLRMAFASSILQLIENLQCIVLLRFQAFYIIYI